ncbi:hypothetical protein [Fimbriiglobus ruber]|uniref:Translation initiation factor 2 n=1 Tax=Fimbriiglobus ruber TaxID=1908690 RepID=A0A225E1T9_9BACT|nr:hypothetical protein [Fimbriiglobus ruber]OWK47193.1 Translation initiation factor 2 [Fimbriiglobus ruber]
MNLTALTLLGLATTFGQPDPGTADPTPDYVRWKSRSFILPIEYKPDQRKTVREIQLWISRDQGQIWEIADKVLPSKDQFEFISKEDGLFWVSMVIVYVDGKKDPPDVSRALPGMKLLIDTVPPVVRVTSAQRVADDIIVDWTVDEKFPNDKATQVTYKAMGSGVTSDWQPVPNGSVTGRTARFKPNVPGPILVQIVATDHAGNTGTGMKEVPAAATGDSPPVQANSGPPVQPNAGPPVQANSGPPVQPNSEPAAPRTPIVIDTTPSPAAPASPIIAVGVTAPGGPVVAQPGTSGPVAVTPVVVAPGPVAPAIVAPVAPAGNPPVALVNVAPAAGSPPANVAMAAPAGGVPAASSGIVGAGGAGGPIGAAGGAEYPAPAFPGAPAPAAPPPQAYVPVQSPQPPAAPAWQPVQQTPPGPVSAYQPTPGPLQVAADPQSPQPLPVRPGSSPTATGGAEQPTAQFVNFLRFDLQYQIDVGPSGVSRIDLYVTRDDGRTWSKWSQHDGKETPLRVQLDAQFNSQKEGDYGFRMVPVSGAGLTDGAPAPGTVPEMRVHVDTTPPLIRPFQPTPDPNQRNTLVLHWEASDRNFGKDPISIEWSEQPNGPWKSIVNSDGGTLATAGTLATPGGPPAVSNRLPNTGSYGWQLPANMSTHKVFLKFAAIDAAGNRSEVVTQSPILVDLTKPRAKIQGITGTSAIVQRRD